MSMNANGHQVSIPDSPGRHSSNGGHNHSSNHHNHHNNNHNHNHKEHQSKSNHHQKQSSSSSSKTNQTAHQSLILSNGSGSSPTNGNQVKYLSSFGKATPPPAPPISTQPKPENGSRSSSQSQALHYQQNTHSHFQTNSSLHNRILLNQMKFNDLTVNTTSI